jgi:hypothetical protein
VTIEVDLADFDSEWADLSDSDIEDWIDDLVSDIQDEFSEDTVVTGVITDIDSNDDLVDFTKDGTDDLEVDFNDEDYRDGGSSGNMGDLEDQLNDEYGSLEDVDISNISLDGDEDDVDVEIEVDLGDFEDEWAALSDSDIENFIEDIVSDIQDEFSGDTVVNGIIVDFVSENELVDFIKDGNDDLEVDFNDGDYR